MYKHSILEEGIIAIEDPGGVRIFVINGQERSVIIDAGYGEHDIAAYASELCTGPYEVICTHGHHDHVGGMKFFDYAWMDERDIAWQDKYKDKYKPFDKKHFDLGGLTLRLCTFIGHTEGMTCILIEERRAMILGDACNTQTWLWMEQCTSIEEYRDELVAFKAEYGSLFDKIYLSHGEPKAYPKELMDSVLKVAEDILAGTNDKVLFNHAGYGTGKEYYAYPVDKVGARADGELGNIVYNAENVNKA